jgi:hypothetical protein
MRQEGSMAQGSLYQTYWYFDHLGLSVLAIGYFD